MIGAFWRCVHSYWYRVDYSSEITDDLAGAFEVI